MKTDAIDGLVTNKAVYLQMLCFPDEYFYWKQIIQLRKHLQLIDKKSVNIDKKAYHNKYFMSLPVSNLVPKRRNFSKASTKRLK